jgi:hypothetical protein
MTEADWLAPADDALKLGRKLDFLLGKTSERKFNLFRFACCRRVWRLLVRDPYRRAVDAAEEWVEGRETRTALEAALLGAGKVLSAVQSSGPHPSQGSLEIRAAVVALHAAKADHKDFSLPNTASYACAVAQEATSAACWAGATAACWPVGASAPSSEWGAVHWQVRQAESTGQGLLLLDIFGNPFRSASIDPAWLAWGGGAVRRLGENAYEERTLPAGTLDASRLAVLADALEEAGCTASGLLGHLREPGPHVRGCWAVDVLLGKA